MKLNWRYMSDSPCFATLKRFIMGFVADMVVIIVVIIIIVIYHGIACAANKTKWILYTS